MRYPVLPVVSAIAAVLVLVPLPSQLRTRNVATICLIASMFLLHATTIVNALVWAGNVRDSAPVWCDISSTILFSWAYAALGATLCVARHVHWITSLRGWMSQRPHRNLFEIMLCGVPALLSIPVRYILSSSRYAIFEDVGCVFNLHKSTLCMVLRDVPGFILAFATFLFSCLAVRNLIRHRISVAAQLGSSQTALPTARFIRLLGVCLLMAIWPLAVVSIIFFIHPRSKGFPVWPGWTAVHKHFHHIPRLPAALRPPALWRSLIHALWIHLVTAGIIFGVFIFTEDVHEDLGKVWVFITGWSPVWRKMFCLHGNRRDEAPHSQWFDADDRVRCNLLAT